MNLLSPKVHGYIDYLADVVLLLSPTIFDLSPLPSNILYTLGTAHLVMNLVTSYPLGVVRWMRFSTHGAIEVWLSLALVLLPWVAGFTGDVTARNVFVVAGIGLFLIWTGTNYVDQSAPAENTIDFGTRAYTDVKHPTLDEPGHRRAI